MELDNELIPEEKKNAEETVTAAEAEVPAASGEPEKKKKKRRRQIHEVTAENDIRYRGPLSYRHLKILGWFCIIISQIAVVEQLKEHVTGNAIPFFCNDRIISLFTFAALPLLLISIFSVLLQKRSNYRSTLVINGALALGMIGLFMLIYHRYILGLAGAFFNTANQSAADAFDDMMSTIPSFRGFLTFNIFIDVFLCVLVMFFLDYTPKHFFTGKKLLIFRSFVIIPLIYELACILIKIMATERFITLPFWVSPLLTTKPPMSILMFLSIVRFIKIREKKYLATGKSIEEYHEFLKTNTNSFQFSRHLILTVTVYSLLDFLLLIFLTAIDLVVLGRLDASDLPLALAESLAKVNSWGFGGTAGMMDLIPIILLFSYTRTHKQKLIDAAIPVVSVIVIVLVYLDGGFQLIQGVLRNSGTI